MIEPIREPAKPSTKAVKSAVSSRSGKDTAAAVTTSSPVARLHAELDGIIQRPVNDLACREAMLDCLVRCRNLVGGAWYHSVAGKMTADVVRLNGPLFDRDDVRAWLTKLSTRAIEERSDITGVCPQVRNLRAICVPGSANRRTQPRDGVETSQIVAEELPPVVLTVLLTDREAKSDDTELLAAQCVVRAWRDWFALSQIRQSSERLLATSALLELVSHVTAADGTRAACQTLVNSLRRHFDARFAVVSLRRGRSVTARLMAVSGIGDFDRNSQQAARLEATLNETIVRNVLTTFPAVKESDRHQYLAHKRAAETTGVESVISIPLRDSSDAVIGALAIGGAAHRLLSSQTTNTLTAAARPSGSAILVAQDREGGFVRRCFRGISRLAASGKGVLLGLTLAAVVAAMFVPMPYHIYCRCQAEPVTRRFSLAPYDGLLENTFAEPGDHVEQGQLLARMEGRELGWELAGLTAESQRANKERDVHMADLQVADSMMSEMEIDKLLARESLLRHRRKHLEMRSPLEGIVLSGSLDKRENYPVSVGQVLYEIAPLDPIRMEVAVPAEERSYLESGMTTQIRVDGDGGEVREGTISRIQPRSEIRGDQNVFIAEIIVPNPDGDLKPGMEGSARITSHDHPLGWNLGHRMWERIKTRIWW